MREYGQVQSAFWQSRDAQNFSDTGKLLALYLLTGPHSNGIGCFRLPDGYVTGDLGWSMETVSAGFDELSRNGFAYRFDGVVFIPNFLRWNKIANNNVAHARLLEFEALPKGEARTRAGRAMLEFCGVWRPEDRRQIETVCETVSAGYANQNPTQPNPDPTQPKKPPPRKKRATGQTTTIEAWLDGLTGADAIPADDSIFDYCEKSRIPREYIELAWATFLRDMRERGTRKIDWRAHFRNAVRRNWFKLWWFDKDGVCTLTTSGVQERRNAA